MIILTLREQVNAFLARLYVPKKAMESYKTLKEFLSSVTIRSPTGRDAHKTRFMMVLIETKGKGARETYQSYDVRFVDFDTIGKRYANAYVYDSDGVGKPKRIDLNSPKTFLLN